MKFVRKNNSVTLFHLWNGVYAINRQQSEEKSDFIKTSDWLFLIKEALQSATQMQAKEVQFRVIKEADSLELIKEIACLGFTKKQDRIEFQAPHDQLASDEGSPIAWQAMEPLGKISLLQAAELLRQVEVGDPDCDPGEDTLGTIQGYLNDSVLTHGPECVQIGFYKNEPIAFIVAQVNPKTFWSRITYMGIIPTSRSLGFGKWVHRHGFQMMREHGGKLYQGGTVLSNQRMIHLFKLHGCAELRRMQEWIYKY